MEGNIKRVNYEFSEPICALVLMERFFLFLVSFIKIKVIYYRGLREGSIAQLEYWLKSLKLKLYCLN